MRNLVCVFMLLKVFKTSYLSLLVMSPSLLVFCGLHRVAAKSQGFAEAAWGFEVVCQEGRCSAKALGVFYIRCRQTCITKDYIVWS